jgi:uncharacterized protein YlbG (UPF0298 family)
MKNEGIARKHKRDWEARQRALLKEHPELERDYRRENANIIVNDLGARYNIDNYTPYINRVEKSPFNTETKNKLKKEYDYMRDNFATFEDVLASKSYKRSEETYLKAVEIEKEFTPLIKELAQNNNVELLGLDYRLKTVDSLFRKVGVDVFQKTYSFTDGDILTKKMEIKDANRYTIQFEKAEQVDDILTQLSKKYTVKEVKNSFANELNILRPYRGINVNLKDSNDNFIEVQFHTQQSYYVKDKGTHSLYEEARKLAKGDERLAELNKLMFEMFKEIKIPENINLITYEKYKNIL